MSLGQCYWESTTPAQIQAVGYGGDGTTCSFQKFENVMPLIHKDGYYIAASTDLYQGFHFPDDWHNSPRAPQFAPCDFTAGGTFSEADPSKMCGQGCGECYLITGPAGSQVFMVNEIADMYVIKVMQGTNFEDSNTVGISCQGLNFNLGSGAGPAGFGAAPCRGAGGTLDAGECNLKVLNYQGPTAVSVKKVPCPVEGQIQIGVHGYNTNSLDGGNLEIVVLHHRLGIKSIWIQGRDAADSPNGWKWVPRSWTNKFNFFPSNGLSGFVFGSSPTKTFDIKIRPTVGSDLICTAVWNPTPTTADPKYGIQTLGSCQFPDPGVCRATANQSNFPRPT